MQKKIIRIRIFKVLFNYTCYVVVPAALIVVFVAGKIWSVWSEIMLVGASETDCKLLFLFFKSFGIAQCSELKYLAYSLTHTYILFISPHIIYALNCLFFTLFC